MRIAIVDDNRQDRERLLEFLANYFRSEQDEYQVSEYEDAASFLAEDHSYDFVIMDIDMPQLSGIDAAKALRQKDERVTLMFVTNMPQYALDGYAVDAIDYVIKPVSYPDFRLKMKKAARYIRQNASTAIALQTADGLVSVQTADIMYVESRLHYLYYHTTGDTYRIRGKLSEAEDRLKTYHFCRSGGSYLVNMAHMTAIEGNDVVVGGERLPLSRRMRGSLMSAFTKYMGGFEA